MEKPIITFDDTARKDVFEMLKAEGKKCCVCNEELTPENFGGAINGKLICKSAGCIYCMSL